MCLRETATLKALRQAQTFPLPAFFSTRLLLSEKDAFAPVTLYFFFSPILCSYTIRDFYKTRIRARDFSQITISGLLFSEILSTCQRRYSVCLLKIPSESYDTPVVVQFALIRDIHSAILQLLISSEYYTFCDQLSTNSY